MTGNRRYPVLRLLTALCVAALGLNACGNEGEQPGRPGTSRAAKAPAVIAQSVVYKSQMRRVEAVGTARARRSALLYPPVGGEVTAVKFAAGDFVRQGTTLLELDARQESLNVALAEVAVDEARQLLARYRRIEDTGAISASQIDEAQTALDGARIRLKQAQVALDDRTVVAPFDGYLGITDIDPGVRITPTTVIASLDDRRVLYIDFAAPEEVFSALSEGKTIDVSPFSNPDSRLTATLLNVDSQIERDTRAVTARAVLDNATDTLRPGMSFKIGFSIEGRRWPVVPEAAIVWGSDGAYLWAIDGDVARRTPVTIVARNQGEVLVDAALPEGTKIVAEGVQKVRDGAAVKVSSVRQVPGSGAPTGALDNKVAR